MSHGNSDSMNTNPLRDPKWSLTMILLLRSLKQTVTRNALVPPSSIPSPVLEVVLEEALACDPTGLRDVQVWRVRCGGEVMVARFYDALYANANTLDRSVAMETNTYEALRDLQGVVVPRFLGYFLTIVDGTETSEDKRSVQVVLLEYIPGRDLRFYSHSRSDEPACDKHKTAVLDDVLLINHLMFLLGIHHLDLSPRNIILKDRPISSTPLCEEISCLLRFKCPTESLIQTMQARGGKDYSKLTLQQPGFPSHRRD
ncbi:hypothetical protein C8R47DRAFT_1217676 [Mycena vitilis]|nr:hypothetical protein C8R47DRAFT_1217676 [Mycena vitilis]